MLPNINASGMLNDLAYFMPESILCVALVAMLMFRLVIGRGHLGWMSLIATGLALVTAWVLWDQMDGTFDSFAGMIVTDSLTRFARLLILSATLLTVVLTLITGIPDPEDSGDFHVLLLGGTLGMLFMASAQHLLMAYIAIEMASLPSYALAGFLKGKRQSSEAALKYVVYGGGASGVMLYGISLIAGKFGTGYLPDLTRGYALALQGQTGGQVDAILVLGTLLILVGLAFKLSAVPFHFWCPDVFEGAAAEVGAFLSVASKAAAFVLTSRLILELTRRNVPAAMLPVYFGPPLAFLAAITATFGNLAAYQQNNLKRLLAYSTIAHAGYMLMGLATVSTEGVQAVLFYLGAYVFMNLGAFAIVAFVRNRTGSEDISVYRGLMTRSPGVVVLFGIFLLSLLGIPPLVGFFAKFQVFAAVYDAGQSEAVAAHPWLGSVYFSLLVIGGLNTALSAVYYIRVLKVMVLDKSLDEVEGRESPPLGVPIPAMAYAVFMAVIVIGLGVVVDPLAAASKGGVQTFAKVGSTLAEREVLERMRQDKPPAGRPKGRPKAQPKAKAVEQGDK
jgi:NADH-quinone oxidoreductase subunit N